MLDDGTSHGKRNWHTNFSLELRSSFCTAPHDKQENIETTNLYIRGCG
jgi:hypothetical protein